VETHATVETVRKAGDRADDGEIAPLVGYRQAVCERQMGDDGSPAIAEEASTGKRACRPAQQHRADGARDDAG
jgi:hypothetical protein